MTVTQGLKTPAGAAASGHAAIGIDRWRRLPVELALLFAMFVAYRAGRLLTSEQTSTAFANAQHVWHVERWLRLPRETGVQDWFLQSTHAAELANTYYAVVHFPATVAFLVWMFLRRPAHYHLVRRTILLLTASALVVHVLFPLAPPRMRPDLGFIDTGAVYGPNVYGPPETASIANQFAAMPSLHVGWAVLIALGLIVAGRSRWRWLWVAHPILTVLVVTATANHWWLDGVVALLLLAASLALALVADRFTISRLLRRQRRRQLPTEHDGVPRQRTRGVVSPR